MQDKLPPEFECLAALVDQPPPRVREAFHFCLAVALEESGKARLINTAQVEGRTYQSYRTVADDVFSVVSSGIDAETERPIRAGLVAILGKKDYRCSHVLRLLRAVTPASACASARTAIVEGVVVTGTTASAITILTPEPGWPPSAAVLPASVEAAPSSAPGPPTTPIGVSAEVLSVIDGDTIGVSVHGDSYGVRYVGIDTPETKHSEKPVEWLGREAAVASVIPGERLAMSWQVASAPA